MYVSSEANRSKIERRVWNGTVETKLAKDI